MRAALLLRTSLVIAKRPSSHNKSLNCSLKLRFVRFPLQIDPSMASVRRSSRQSAVVEVTTQVKEVVVKESKIKVKAVVKKSTKTAVAVPAKPGHKRKASLPAQTPSVKDAPATPKKKAKKETTESAAAEEIKTPKRVRRADPHATNAPLQTPGGSRILKAYSTASNLEDFQETSANGLITTENLLERACAHLCAVDPDLEKVIKQHHCKVFSPEGLIEPVNPFVALCSSIIGQQVSGAAARSIKRKFIGLFLEMPDPEDMDYGGEVFPTPAQVAVTDLTVLRTAGLSQRKAEYIQGLAEKFASGELSAKMLVEASDEELLEKLIAVRGLGRWSVEMFACFALKRMDIFSTGDLGVQRGMAAYVGRDVSKLKAKGGGKWKYMKEQEMLDIANKFAPYR
jgi:DNA-3-methyladenine glycosylase II